MGNGFTNFFEINRIEENLRNARKRYYNLYDAIKAQSGALFYSYLCETITWIDNTNEWFLQKQTAKYKEKRNNTLLKIDEEEHILAVDSLLGIRAIFNLFKHDMSVDKLFKVVYIPPEEDGGFYFQKLVFLPVQEIEIEKMGNHAEKRPFLAYNDHLQGKEVMKVLTATIGFLETYNREFKKEKN